MTPAPRIRTPRVALPARAHRDVLEALTQPGARLVLGWRWQRAAVVDARGDLVWEGPDLVCRSAVAEGLVEVATWGEPFVAFRLGERGWDVLRAIRRDRNREAELIEEIRDLRRELFFVQGQAFRLRSAAAEGGPRGGYLQASPGEPDGASPEQHHQPHVGTEPAGSGRADPDAAEPDDARGARDARDARGRDVSGPDRGDLPADALGGLGHLLGQAVSDRAGANHAQGGDPAGHGAAAAAVGGERPECAADRSRGRVAPQDGHALARRARIERAAEALANITAGATGGRTDAR